MDRYVEAGHVQHQRTPDKSHNPQRDGEHLEDQQHPKGKTYSPPKSAAQGEQQHRREEAGSHGQIDQIKDPVNEVRLTQLTQRNTDQRPQPRRSHHTRRPASQSVTPSANRNGSTMGTHHPHSKAIQAIARPYNLT